MTHRTSRRHGSFLLTALALTCWAVLTGISSPPRALAESPALSPSPSEALPAGGDVRSEGQGAGLVGSPLLVGAGVLLLGAGTALVTYLYARTDRPSVHD